MVEIDETSTNQAKPKLKQLRNRIIKGLPCSVCVYVFVCVCLRFSQKFFFLKYSNDLNACPGKQTVNVDQKCFSGPEYLIQISPLPLGVIISNLLYFCVIIMSKYRKIVAIRKIVVKPLLLQLLWLFKKIDTRLIIL